MARSGMPDLPPLPAEVRRPARLGGYATRNGRGTGA